MVLVRFIKRNNIIHPTLFFLFSLLRNLLSKYFLENFLDYSGSYFTIILMFIGELLIGFIYTIKNRNKKKSSQTEGNLIYNPVESNYKGRDNLAAIIILIFLATFLDFISFFLNNFLNSKLNLIEYDTYFIRLRYTLFCINSLILKIFGKILIYLHQAITLIIISVFMLAQIGIEFIFSEDLKNGFKCILISVGFNVLLSLQWIVEFRILSEDSVPSWKLLLIEGIFGIIISLLGLIFNKNPLNEYNFDNKGKLCLFILGFILYIILSGYKNIYRLSTNEMLDVNFLIWVDTIYDITGLVEKFIIYQKIDIFNNFLELIIISLIIYILCIFFGSIYNEVIIIHIFNLDKNTFKEIDKRGKLEIEIEVLSQIDYDDRSVDIIDKRKILRKKSTNSISFSQTMNQLS